MDTNESDRATVSRLAETFDSPVLIFEGDQKKFLEALKREYAKNLLSITFPGDESDDKNIRAHVYFKAKYDLLETLLYAATNAAPEAVKGLDEMINVQLGNTGGQMSTF